MTSLKKTWIWLSVYAVSMAALEAAVVVYLRELYYGGGADLFPMRNMAPHLALVELCREAATILMLLAIGVLAGRNAWSRFGYFLAAFGIWDIFYYVFLALFIQWPSTLLDWDILFLIPVPWFGPVLAPCLVALAMIVLGAVMSLYERKSHALAIRWYEGLSMVAGCILILYTFTRDSIALIAENSIDQAGNELFRQLAAFVPESYSWSGFSVGFSLLLAGIVIYYRRIRISNQVLY